MPVTVNHNGIDVDATGSTFASSVKTEVLAVQTDLGKMSEKTETETISGDKTHSGTFVRNNAFFSAHTTMTSGVADEGSFSDVTWDSVDANDALYTLDGSDIEVTVSEAGRYRINYDGTLDHTTDSTNFRVSSEWKIQKKPSGGSFSDLAGSTRYQHNRKFTSISSGRDTVSMSGKIFNLAANDTIKLIVGIEGTVDTDNDVIFVSGGTSICIERV